jgi:RimJ/RimL family protein N-acetyltransferase
LPLLQTGPPPDENDSSNHCSAHNRQIRRVASGVTSSLRQPNKPPNRRVHHGSAAGFYGTSVKSSSDWPAAESIDTPRLILEPLRVAHADEMLSVLGDRGLYEFIGGEPPSLATLRARYARQVAGSSADGAHGWLNWIVRARKSRDVLGAVQATLSLEGGKLQAELAWIVGVAGQGQGYATEATGAMLAWLARHGVVVFVAHIHPGHSASIWVARRLGLTATGAVVDGEIRWVGEPRLRQRRKREA